MLKRIFIILLVFTISITFAQSAPPRTPQRYTDEAESSGGGKGAIIQIKGKMMEGLSGKLSATFQSTPVKDVIRLFATQAKLNIIISPKVKANITASFKNAPIKDAFLAILSANNIYYLEQGSIVKILTINEYKNELKKSHLVTRTYDASIIDLKNLAKIIKPMMTPGVGIIAVDKQSSKIMITDVEDNFERIENAIEQVSSLPYMVEIEARIVQVSLDDGTDIGIQWEMLNIDNAVDAKFNFSPSGGVGDEAFNISVVKAFAPNPMSLNALVSLLSTTYDLKTVANPKITVVNRVEGKINIGDEVPYIKSITKSATTSDQTSQVDFITAGIELKVTPYISKDGNIKLKVYVERSSYQFVAITSTENAPKKTTTKVTCEAVLKDGNTLVIGGLIREEETETVKGIPFLSKIPVLKYFFSHTDYDINRSELVIFLTPHIIKDGNSNIRLNEYSDEVLKRSGDKNYQPKKKPMAKPKAKKDTDLKR